MVSYCITYEIVIFTVLKGKCFTKGIVHTSIELPIDCIYQAE